MPRTERLGANHFSRDEELIARADLLRETLALAKDYPQTAGTFPFCFSDHRDPSKVHNGYWNELNLKGLVDYRHNRKLAFAAVAGGYRASNEPGSGGRSRNRTRDSGGRSRNRTRDSGGRSRNRTRDSGGRSRNRTGRQPLTGVRFRRQPLPPALSPTSTACPHRPASRPGET
ncbi:MAG: hypothetical protein BWZ02_01605 [Lentisphaerae bacterium ADurb.BinA184]|nr:MAG: hypothetical protein BWZ02_01605 [Lentisphaerae bacterium ADurb.BinA184]